MNLSKQKRKSKSALALASAVVVFAAIMFIPDFQNAKQRTPKADETGSENSMAPRTDDDTGILEEIISVNGVPINMRWQADRFSSEEMKALAALVYGEFSETFLEGERRPDQMYSLDGMYYDYETENNLTNMFSDTGNLMIWQLSVTLPDNWREDKGMGMLQDETSQKQEYDIALVKNTAGEWEVAESTWRVFHDNTDSFQQSE